MAQYVLIIWSLAYPNLPPVMQGGFVDIPACEKAARDFNQAAGGGFAWICRADRSFVTVPVD